MLVTKYLRMENPFTVYKIQIRAYVESNGYDQRRPIATRGGFLTSKFPPQKCNRELSVAIVYQESYSRDILLQQKLGQDLVAFLITGISLFRQSHLLTSGRIPLERYSRPPARPLSSWGTIGPGRGVNLHTQIPTIDLERRERRRLRIAGRTRVCLQQWAYPFGWPWPGASLKEGQ